MLQVARSSDLVEAVQQQVHPPHQAAQGPGAGRGQAPGQVIQCPQGGPGVHI